MSGTAPGTYGRSPGATTTRWEGDFIAYFHARRAAYVRTAYAVLGSWPAAEDATQEAFSRVYVKWPAIRGETPDPYARKVLVNTCLRMLSATPARAGDRGSVPERPVARPGHAHRADGRAGGAAPA